jgi:hypothetical protein
LEAALQKYKNGCLGMTAHHPAPQKKVYSIQCSLLLDKAHYQAFWGVLIDLIVELLGLIIKPFDNQTES